MGTGRLIGRNFWGFVCSDDCGKGKRSLRGESVGVWRWVILLRLDRDGALGCRVRAFVPLKSFNQRHGSAQFYGRTGRRRATRLP